MDNGNRDELWKSSWETYYDSYYYDIALSNVISRWKLFDIVTKIIVALTATGSAVAGWSLWNVGTSKEVWALLAGTAAVLSIIHAVTQVQSILEALTESRSIFRNIRVTIESFRHELNIFPDFDVIEKHKEYKQLRVKYENCITKFNGDLLLTRALAESSQKDLNRKLGV